MPDYLFFSELEHILLSLGIGLILVWRFREWRLLPIAFLFGFFIDLDHWFDYVINFGLDLNLNRFFHAPSYLPTSGKIFVLLHGWEWPFVSGWLGHRLGQLLH